MLHKIKTEKPKLKFHIKCCSMIHDGGGSHADTIVIKQEEEDYLYVMSFFIINYLYVFVF